MIIFLIILILSCIILIHECGHFFAAKFFRVKVEEFGFGFPPRLWGKKIGETLYSLNLLPFGGFVKIFGEERHEHTDNEEQKEILKNTVDLEKSFSTQSAFRRAIILLAGVSMNIILGWILLSVVFMIGSPHHLVVTDVIKDSPAALQGIKIGDIISKIEGNNILLRDPISTEEFVRVVRSTAGTQLTITLERGKEILTRVVEGRVNPPEGEGALGIGIEDIGFPAESFFQSLWDGAVRSVEMMWLILVGLISFFAKIFVTPKILDTVTGPVGIFTMARHAGELGIVYLLQLMGMISLNLAVLNCIPFPALDGGRVLFLIIEKIKGSPLSLRGERIANVVGFIILLLLMGVVTVGDILKII